MNCKTCEQEVKHIKTPLGLAITEMHQMFLTDSEIKLGVTAMVREGGIINKSPVKFDLGYIQHKYFCKGK